MTEVNHRSGTKRKRYPKFAYKTEKWFPRDSDPEGEEFTYLDSEIPLHNGYRPRNGKPWGYIDKSLHGAGRISVYADAVVGAGIGNDFTNGNRGMAKAIRGAKKFVRTRIRFKEKVALDREVRSLHEHEV